MSRSDPVNPVLAWRDRLLTQREQNTFGVEHLTLESATRAIDESMPISVNEIWFEERLGSEWVVALRLVLQQERVVVGECRVFPSAPPRERCSGRWIAEVLGTDAPVPAGGLRSRMLRRVTLTGFLHRLHELVEMGPEVWPWPLAATTSTTPGAKRGRKAVYSRAFYAKAAVIYEAAYHRGLRPTRDVSRLLHLSQGQARGVVERARKMGLLEQTERGVASGRATQEAHTLAKQRLPRIATNSETGGSKRPQVAARKKKNARKSSRRKFRA
jgi:hypothetical protein